MPLRHCHEFEIVVADAEAATREARLKIEGEGGTFSGDGWAGSFEGQTPAGWVKGSYRRSGSGFLIDVHRKPVLVSCTTIERTIREFFREH